MRFEDSSGGSPTWISFDFEKVRLVEKIKHRRYVYQTLEGLTKFKKKGESYELDIQFYGLDSSDVANLRDLFYLEPGDLTKIDNYDEVANGDTYYTYSTDMLVIEPEEVLIVEPESPFKVVDRYTARWTVQCTSKSTAIK